MQSLMLLYDDEHAAILAKTEKASAEMLQIAAVLRRTYGAEMSQKALDVAFALERLRTAFIFEWEQRCLEAGE